MGLIGPQVDGNPRTASCGHFQLPRPLPFEPSPRGHGALVRRCHAARAPLHSARPWQCAASTMEKSLRSRDSRTATNLGHSIQRPPTPILNLPVLHSRHECHCLQLSMRRCQGNGAAPSAARGGCVLSTRRRASMICRFVRARTDGQLHRQSAATTSRGGRMSLREALEDARRHREPADSTGTP